jgi:hypothetical protein
MRKKSTWIVIGLVVVLGAALAFGGGDRLWHMLLAMHGRH